MSPNTFVARAASVLLILITGLVALKEWGVALPVALLPLTLGATVVLLTPQVRWSRRAFVLAAVLLCIALIATQDDWQSVLLAAVNSGAFIAAFFTALSTLRNVAETSPAIAACGTFLAKQPPGRRYAALTSGGHLFALILNYGAISLLGALATSAAKTETNAEIRGHRTRRMLLAVQRGFIASLPWSPLAFCMAITTVLIPGASWTAAVVPGLVTSALIAVTGWGMDVLFKPTLSAPLPPREQVEGSWTRLTPLLTLISLLGFLVFGLHETTGVRIVGVIIVVVPLVSLSWGLSQSFGARKDIPLPARLAGFVIRDLPDSRSEITLLIMAGFIGTVGAPLLSPLIAASGLHPENLPPWLLLVGLVWIIPLLGQIGMNPILAVSLMAPSIPEAASLGLSPTAIVTAIGAGWALGGISSPFTATTLLIGSFGGVSALHVGIRWNGGYIIAVGGLMTAWVLAFAFLLS